MGLSHSSEHRTVALIVDTARGAREKFAEHLARHGITTIQAQDGFQGMAKAAALRPDVIAADLGMNGHDVVDMCFRLKRQDSTKHIPIIAVTAIAAVSAVEQALRAGCVSVLVKPCPPHVLLEEIRRVLALPHHPAA